MSRRRSIVAAGAGSAAAIATMTAALAAYESPRLYVTQEGSAVTVQVEQSAGDDATAILRLISPFGTRIAQPRPPGGTVGSARATLNASGAQVTAEGNVVVVAPDRIPPAERVACAGGAPVEATWLLTLAGAGITVDAPVYVLAGGDLLMCIPHPSTTDRGAQLVGLELVLDGALVLPTAGTWVSIWIPYGAGGAPDAARAVASPAAVGAGSVTLAVRAKGAGAVVTGIVRQGGAPRSGARVTITGGPRAAARRKLGTATTNGVGSFTFRAGSGTYFRASATASRASPPGLCIALEPLLRPIPCVNPTLSGFSVTSKAAKKR